MPNEPARAPVHACVDHRSIDLMVSQKEAAGRPKDLLMATEYRVLSDELRAP
jgi:hypothetical protein